MKTQVMGAKSEVINQIAASQSAAGLKVILDAPDVFVCAAAMGSLPFYEGRGDRAALFNMVLARNPA